MATIAQRGRVDQRRRTVGDARTDKPWIVRSRARRGCTIRSGCSV